MLPPRRTRKTVALVLLLIVVPLIACDCGDGEPTDEDLIEKFIEDVTGDVDAGYVARCLAYVDFERYPIDVRVPHHAGVYNADRSDEILGRFRQVVKRRFMGSELKRRSSNFEIDGDKAEVKLALLSAVGPLRAEITLEKPAPGTWLVSRVHIEPRF